MNKTLWSCMCAFAVFFATLVATPLPAFAQASAPMGTARPKSAPAVSINERVLTSMTFDEAAVSCIQNACSNPETFAALLEFCVAGHRARLVAAFQRYRVQRGDMPPAAFKLPPGCQAMLRTRAPAPVQDDTVDGEATIEDFEPGTDYKIKAGESVPVHPPKPPVVAKPKSKKGAPRSQAPVPAPPQIQNGTNACSYFDDEGEGSDGSRQIRPRDGAAQQSLDACFGTHYDTRPATIFAGPYTTWGSVVAICKTGTTFTLDPHVSDRNYLIANSGPEWLRYEPTNVDFMKSCTGPDTVFGLAYTKGARISLQKLAPGATGTTSPQLRVPSSAVPFSDTPSDPSFRHSSFFMSFDGASRSSAPTKAQPEVLVPSPAIDSLDAAPPQAKSAPVQPSRDDSAVPTGPPIDIPSPPGPPKKLGVPGAPKEPSVTPSTPPPPDRIFPDPYQEPSPR